MNAEYTVSNLIGLFIQSIFVDNILLAYFLGMCTYLACSSKVKTAHKLGQAVIVVMTSACMINWCVHHYITKAGALVWLSSIIPVDFSMVDLSFLEFLMFISTIAAFVQILEMTIEKFLPALYNSLGIYLPLITVNCAILGACLFSTARDYDFVPNTVYVIGSAIGWWLAIVIIAAIREKLRYSNLYPGFDQMAITFISSGLVGLAFMGLGGINLKDPTPQEPTQMINDNDGLPTTTTPSSDLEHMA